MPIADPISRPDRLIALLLQAAMIVVFTAQQAGAQTEGDPDAGRKLAGTWCENCHVVGISQQRGTSTGAPTFTAIAAMKSTTFMGLQAFLQTPHARMPDFHLSRDEIDDVAAYIISLKKQ
jgi:mono/diheme cytochrome c family protein